MTVNIKTLFKLWLNYEFAQGALEQFTSPLKIEIAENGAYSLGGLGRPLRPPREAPAGLPFTPALKRKGAWNEYFLVISVSLTDRLYLSEFHGIVYPFERLLCSKLF